MPGDEDYNGKVLAEKLVKLNNSQQSINSLSSWCITHRKKAKQIVETWHKVFKSARPEQFVSFLYLANDILQNSRRKGSEFVNEFWKFLPGVLKNVHDKGDENGKKESSRLVGIWEERKVFGSRGQNLKDIIQGKNPSPSTALNGKISNPIKVLKRDAQSLRMKVAIGGLPEKIISAFQSMYDEMVNEEAALNKCKAAISLVKLLENDIESSSSLGNSVDLELVEKIQEQENVLRDCVTQLENAEATRLVLTSCLKDALQDQESKLELIHHELQISRGEIEQAISSQKKLSSRVVPQATPGDRLFEGSSSVDHSRPFELSNVTPVTAIHSSTVSSSKLNEEDSKKAMAAVVAAKLAASTSSAQMLTSVLSSFAAKEAASLSNGLNSSGSSSGLPFFDAPEKRRKLEPESYPEVEHFEGNRATNFGSLQPAVSNNPVDPSNGMQHMSQGIQMQTSFTHPLQQPSIPPVNSTATQLGQSAPAMPYGYLPPPPPSLPSHPQLVFPRPVPLQIHQMPPQQLQSPQSQQQQAANGNYYQPPPGFGFYGQNQQAATPPVPRQ